MSIVERFDLASHPGRVFVLGDLHGMAHALDRLLARAGFDPACDLVWSLGDLIDRGPYSERCLALLEQPWFRAIRGNHEQFMLDAVEDHGAWLRWTVNGGEWSQSYPWDAPDLHARLAALPLACELTTAVGRIGLIHADVDPDYDWPQLLEALEQDRGEARQHALWSRSTAKFAMRGWPEWYLRGVDLVLVGHSIVPQCFRWGNIWFLDTGAVVSDDSSAALSMLEVHPRLTLWSEPTAGDGVTANWWSGHLARLSAALARHW